MNQIEQRKLLQKLAADPAEFRAALKIPSSKGERPLGEVAADFQRKDFAAIDKAFMAICKGAKPEPARLWIERTKGASKDTDLAAMVLWLIAFCPRPFCGQVGAADQDQADELRKAAAGMVRLNPWLRKLLNVEVQATAIINRKTDARVDIIPADDTGSHGARPDLLILNELTHTSNRGFCETLLDNASKMPNGVVVIVTNAGHVGSWQEEWRKNAIESPRWYFSAYAQPAPWLDPAELSEARRRNRPGRYARLWMGQWVSDSESAIDEDCIAAALTLSGPLDGPEPGWIYVAALDIGLSRDASALALVGQHVGHVETRPGPPAPVLPPTLAAAIDLGLIDPPTNHLTESLETCYEASGRLKLAGLQIWRPSSGAGKVSIEAIESAIIDLHQRFAPIVACDFWQAAYLIERLRGKGVPTQTVDFTPHNLKSMASATLEAFSERQIDLYAQPDLLRDLRALHAVEKAYGVRLESPRGPHGHGDSATALSIALHNLKQNTWLPPAEQNRPLVCWP